MKGMRSIGQKSRDQEGTMNLRDQWLGIEQPKNVDIDFRWHMRKEGESRVMPIHYWTEQLQWVH